MNNRNLLEFDFELARQLTPASKDIIHFNNAGAALMPKVVVDALIDYIHLEEKLGGYEAAELKAEQIQKTYHAAAKLLNCGHKEIAFVESATRGWDMAFYSIPIKAGDVILTGMAEYESNYLAYLQLVKTKGIKVEVIPNDEFGQISVKKLENKISKEVKLIAISHIPTNGGLINPAEEIGKIAKQANILYLLDSCQAAGQIPLDVKKLNCDFLSFTGRKYLRGPRGTGILYVNESICDKLEPVFIDLQAAEWVAKDKYIWTKSAGRFEQWESNCGAKLALGVSIDYALSWGLGAIEKRISLLASYFREQLKKIEKVQLLDLGERKCGIISFNVDGFDPQFIHKNLSLNKINISVSSKRYTLLDMEDRKIQALCRASVHYYNTIEEIQHFYSVLKKIVEA